MSELDTKKKVYRILRSPLVLCLLAIVFFFLARGVWKMYLKDQTSTAELKSAQERLAKLEARQTALVTANEKLSTESGIESEIRDRLQMAKIGEKEIVIVENEEMASQAISEPRSFLQKIMDFFTIR